MDRGRCAGGSGRRQDEARKGGIGKSKLENEASRESESKIGKVNEYPPCFWEKRRQVIGNKGLEFLCGPKEAATDRKERR